MVGSHIRWSVVAWAACLSSCTAGNGRGETEHRSELEVVPSSTVIEAFEAAGFLVQEGVFEFVDLSKCCAPGGFCSGTNPSSPYAVFRLPPGPGQTEPNPNPDEKGWSSSWRLREDEVVVWIGQTPPRAAYFSFQDYLMDRLDGTERVPLFASLGDAMNHAVLRTAAGPAAPFASQSVILHAANAHAEAAARSALIAAGVEDDIINTNPLPAARLRMGLNADADSMAVYLRMSVVASDLEREAYIADPPARVYRLTPVTVGAPVALPDPAPRQKGSGSSESRLKFQLNSLKSALRSELAREFPGASIQDLATTAATFNGASCIEKGSFCGGDCTDALYMGPGASFSFGANEIIVAYGVNHVVTGKATYTNVTINNQTNAMGVVAVDDRQFPGTADPYIVNPAMARQLYVVRFARSCAGMPSCFEVPTEGCPSLPLDAPAKLAFRAYLEPATKTGPLASEVLVDRAMKITLP